jgi:tetratricopeptide (TPR) repeat protein
METPLPDNSGPVAIDRPGKRSRSSVRLAAAAAALLAVAVYANSLRNGLVYDDINVITANEAVTDARDWRRILLTPSWFARANPTIAYRPLTTWTFALDHAAHGLHPFGYHLVNVLAHAGVAALVVALAAALGLSTAPAGFAGLFFAAHPIHTEAVANVVGRAEILATGLALSALLLQQRAAIGVRPGLAIAGAAAAYGLALLSKEHAIALLALLPLADLVCLDGGSPRLFLRRLRGRRLAFYVAVAAITAGYLVLRTAALGGVIGAGGANLAAIDFHANPSASAPTLLRVLTALKVQALALWLLFVPLELSADYSYRQIPVVGAAAEPGAIAGLAVAAGLAGLAVVLWRWNRTAFFWLALALVTYGIVSNIVFPIGTIFGERLLYLPSVGFCALLAMALARPAGSRGRIVAGSVAVALVVAWGLGTVRRNPIWHSALSLAKATVKSAPASAHAHHMLGTTYAKGGRDDDALAAFADALAIDPDHVHSLYDAGVIYQRRDQLIEALAAFRQVTDREPEYFPAWINIGAVNNQRGSFAPALGAADRAVAIRPDIANAHVVRGFALRGLGRREEAGAAFEEALRLDARRPDALFGLGANAAEQEDFLLAASAFERLVDVAPSRDAYRGLVFSYRRAGRNGDAARAAAAAREQFPDDPFFAP